MKLKKVKKALKASKNKRLNKIMEDEAEKEKRTAVIYPVEGTFKYDEDGNEKKPCTIRQKALRDIAKAMKKEHAAKEDLENAETKAGKRAAKRLIRAAIR